MSGASTKPASTERLARNIDGLPRAAKRDSYDDSAIFDAGRVEGYGERVAGVARLATHEHRGAAGGERWLGARGVVRPAIDVVGLEVTVTAARFAVAARGTQSHDARRAGIGAGVVDARRLGVGLIAIRARGAAVVDVLVVRSAAGGIAARAVVVADLAVTCPGGADEPGAARRSTAHVSHTPSQASLQQTLVPLAVVAQLSEPHSSFEVRVCPWVNSSGTTHCPAPSHVPSPFWQGVPAAVPWLLHEAVAAHCPTAVQLEASLAT